MGGGAIVVIGAQWGDEGKGKIVDWLVHTYRPKICARFGGGDNAGHTLIDGEGDDTNLTAVGSLGKDEFVLHLISSGIRNKEVICVLGQGMVINPKSFLREIAECNERGYTVTPERLKVSDRAHVLLPHHIALDKAKERRAEKPIGTTLKGIGPAYVDKYNRSGIRMADTQRPDFRELLTKNILEHEQQVRQLEHPMLWKLYDAASHLRDAATQYLGIPRADRIGEVIGMLNQLQPYITDTGKLLRDTVKTDTVLLEGAQGAMLDVDTGTYPYVTSSHTIGGGVSTGSGLPPSAITKVIGVAKAYVTRVGGGPFPTKIGGNLEEEIRKKGHEYGATTGRPRSCGWVDTVALRHAIGVSGIQELALTKMDVLSGLREVKICVAYEIDGKEVRDFPARLDLLERAKPIYVTLPGWGLLEHCTTLDTFSKEARNYVSKLEELLERPITIFSNGRDRKHTHHLRAA